MTTRATDVIGKTVVSADTGKKLGTVGDLLLDDTGRMLVGLVIRHGVLRTEEVLTADQVQSFGTDAVVSRSDRLLTAKEWHEQHPSPDRAASR
jgi:uncharacterized protein YrrD